MERSEILSKYNENCPLYERAGKNTKEALEQFLNENEIQYLVITTRVKKFKSLYDKIDRKNYTKPFEENEDFCGVRIVLYYLEDIDKVNDIITKNYNIHDSIDKSDLLKTNEFGYRSDHHIITIKDSWCVTPNYKGLKDLKIEVQVRSILMHAWAEIEHKLGYKTKQQVPKKLRRNLSLLSAKLEDADLQFQEIKKQSSKYQKSTMVSFKAGEFSDKELNLDNFQAFLDFKFPNRKGNIDETRALLNEILATNITLEDIISGYNTVLPYLETIETESFGSNIKSKERNGWAQTGIVRTILDLTVDRYYNMRKSDTLPSHVIERDKRWRNIIKNKV